MHTLDLYAAQTPPAKASTGDNNPVSSLFIKRQEALCMKPAYTKAESPGASRLKEAM